MVFQIWYLMETNVQTLCTMRIIGSYTFQPLWVSGDIYRLSQNIFCQSIDDVYVVVQFYPWFKFYFPLFLGMVRYDNEFTTNENKIWTKDKIEPQQIYIVHDIIIYMRWLLHHPVSFNFDSCTLRITFKIWTTVLAKMTMLRLIISCNWPYFLTKMKKYIKISLGKVMF